MDKKVLDFLPDMFGDAARTVRFTFGFKDYLRDKVDFSGIRAFLKARMARREESFLSLLRRGIFEYKKSPYAQLLALARLTYGDVERSVSRIGLDETLKMLCSEGIFVTIEEFKGRKPLVRKGKSFSFREKDFDNPYIAACYERRSGGTRSAGTRIACDFDFLAQTAPHRGFINDILGLRDAPHVIVRPVLPYGPGMLYVLHMARLGMKSPRWFSIYDESRIPVSRQSRWGMEYLFFLGRVFGAGFPQPEFIEPKNIHKIIGVVKSLLAEHGRCCVFCNVSTAVRLSLAAQESRTNLAGLVFQGCGEPLTETRKKEIEASGARYILYYAFTEAGLVGSLCLKPSAVDDIHLFGDFLAAITHSRRVVETDVNAFLFTSVLSSSPKILLNVETGDYGVLEKRSCGCPYDELGYHDHIRSIRSFEKLTSEGMTFYGSDLVRIIEDVFPSKFGGSSVDYQLVEEEGEKGIARVVIRISPSVGPLKEDDVIGLLLEELGRSGDSQRVMAQTWFEAGTVAVRRDPPQRTGAGKQFPLHTFYGRKA